MFINREPRFYIAVYWSDSYWRCGPGKDDYVLCNLAKMVIQILLMTIREVDI